MRKASDVSDANYAVFRLVCASLDLRAGKCLRECGRLGLGLSKTLQLLNSFDLRALTMVVGVGIAGECGKGTGVGDFKLV